MHRKSVRNLDTFQNLCINELMKENIKKVLLNIGLTNNEADVFLAVFKFGPIHVSDIAKKAKIKRPTVYLILRSLINKQMVVQNNKNFKRPIYYANDLKKIFYNLNAKVTNFAKSFPELNNITANPGHSPHLKIYEGLNGMRDIYQQALSASWEEEILVYGTVSSNLENEAHNILYKQWMSMIKKNRVKMREILDETRENYKYRDKIKKIYNPKHKIRFRPANFKFLPNKIRLLEADSIIFQDKVAFFSSYNTELYVIVIDHQQICNIYKNLFEMAWEIANEA